MKKSLYLMIILMVLAGVTHAATNRSRGAVKSQSPWGAFYYLENEKDGNVDIEDMRSSNYFGINYKMTKDTKLQARFNYVNYYNDKESYFNDTQLRAYIKWGKISKWKFDTQIRFYIPTVSYSTDVGKHQLRANFNFKRRINSRWGLKFSLSPRFYFYTVDELGQRSAKAFYSVMLSQKITKSIGFNYFLGYTHSHYYKGTRYDDEKPQSEWQEPKSNADATWNAISANWTYSKNLSFELMQEQFHDVRSGDKFYPFKPTESTYYLSMTVSI